MPSHNIDSCARISDTAPLVACGHTKRPRSRRLRNRHIPSPSCQINLIKSPLRPRKMKTCPDRGLLSSAFCTRPLRLVKPRRMSVTPAQARSACWPKSSAQALKNGPNDLGINRAFKTDQRTTRNLDVHRQARRRTLALLGLCFRWLAAVHGDRK